MNYKLGGNGEDAVVEALNVTEKSFFYKLKKSKITGPLGLVLCFPSILFFVNFSTFLALVSFALSLTLSYIGVFKGPKGLSKVLAILGLIILSIHAFLAMLIFAFGYVMASGY